MTFNPRRAIVAIYTHAKGRGQKSVGSKVRGDWKRTDGHTDGRTEAIALPPVLTRSVISVYAYVSYVQQLSLIPRNPTLAIKYSESILWSIIIVVIDNLLHAADQDNEIATHMSRNALFCELLSLPIVANPAPIAYTCRYTAAKYL